MRLLELSLLAFGSFAGERIDLSAEGPVLHIIYGPNEAGKSTALRAITGLFYGIEERTSDAYLHDRRELRIGGRLAHQGEVLDVVRRKGRKNTLLDPQDAPIDEARLTRALAGVSKAQFLTMFGLDHRTLREGAKALLRGEGGLGESLFDAGGAQGVGEVLAELRAEAEALYKSRGQNQPLAEAFRAYKELGTTVMQRGVEASGWVVQQEAVAETEARRETLEAERSELVATRRRLEQAKRVLPILVERRTLRAQLEALADAPRLASDAVARRLEAMGAKAESERDATRLSAELEELDAERAELVVDDALAQLDEATVKTLQEMVTRHRNASADRPKRLAQRRERIEQAEQELAKLGSELVTKLRDEALEPLERATEMRVASLAQEHGVVREGAERAERLLAQTEEMVAALEEELAALPPVREAGALDHAVARARRAGDVDAAVARAEARCDHAREALAAEAQGLPFVEGAVEAILELPVPTLAWVREQARHRQAFAERSAGRRERGEQLAEALERTRVALDALTRQADVPTEAALAQARAARDGVADELAAALDGEGAPEVLARYRGEVTRVDALADRLRREADRVARRAQLEAEVASIERQQATLDEERQEHEAQERASDETWRAAWGVIEATTPEAMLDWLDRRRVLVEHAERCAADEAELAEANALRRSACESLLATLDLQEGGDRLAPLLDRAEAQLAELVEEGEVRRSLEERLAEQRRPLARLQTELRQARETLTRWEGDWTTAMTRLGLPATARVDEATAHVAVLRDAFGHLAQAEGYARRVAGMDRDAQQFADTVRPLVERLAPDLVERPTDEAADALMERHERARLARDKRDALDERRGLKREELQAAMRAAEEAATALAELARAAGVASPDELEDAERRGAERLDLEERVQRLDEKLFDEGLALDELEARVAGVDLEEARERLPAIEQQEETLRELARDLDRELGTQRAGLERLQKREGAHAAADERQAVVARIRRLAERWAQLRLAAVTLEREVERYREQNEGPIIRRASAIFPELTMGEYGGLRSSYDERDEPELRCLGVDGSDVPVDGLSDGARDQLYLALRLASLERYAEQADLMPFVADDILVHFDEDRAEAAIKVLQRFAATTQVLMFTHQHRHVELARQALAPEHLTVHELTGGRRRARVG